MKKRLLSIMFSLGIIYSSFSQANTNLGESSGTGGSANVFIGSNAGQFTTSPYNAIVGSLSGQANTSGASNCFFGYASGYYNTTGSNNTFYGRDAGFNNITGNNNTYIGLYAGFHGTSDNNTATGYQALINSTGSNNSAEGYYALYNTTTGSSNAGYGYQALFTNTTGSNNTALGNGADVNNGALTNATALGSGALATGSNMIQLGNAAVTLVQVGTGTTATLATGGLQVTGGTPGTGKVLTSDANGVATWQSPVGGGSGSQWTTSGSNIYFNTPGSRVGIGTSTPQNTLDVVGTISTTGLQIAGGSQGAGKVLTSDANGVATWQTLTGSGTSPWTSSSANVYFTGGFVGVGTTTPGYTLDVNGTTNSGSLIAGSLKITGGNPGTGKVLTSDANGVATWQPASGSSQWTNNGTSINYAGGNVGIGSSTPDALLAVKGQIHANEVRVDLNVPGPDYVFEKDYRLASIEEIKNYIDQNKHLPDVPSAKQMEKEGVLVSEMNMLLLRKIEELILHTIEMNKKLIELTKENQGLKSRIEAVEKR